MRASARALVGACFTVLLGGCAYNPPLDLAALSPGRPSVALASVPFYPQQDYQCGPAALAGLLGASGVNASPDSLAPQVYLPGRQGSLQLELVAATRRAGRLAYPLPGTPEALLAQLASGRPVLVFQNLQTTHFPAWHYALLVGYDTRSNRFLLNSGSEQAMPMSAPAFLRTWEWAGRWAMVALPPGELPEQAVLSTTIDAVAGFEAVAGGPAAAPAWRATLQRWPEDPRPYLALGNLAYAEGSLPEAARYYRRGLARQPRDPALGNNLASVLGELGCPGTGRALLQEIDTGLAPDSNWRPIIRATLAELAALPASEDSACDVGTAG